MIEGMSPEEIIAWLVANDVQNNPQVRQYGITDFDSLGHPRSAAFTGTQLPQLQKPYCWAQLCNSGKYSAGAANSRQHGGKIFKYRGHAGRKTDGSTPGR